LVVDQNELGLGDIEQHGRAIYRGVLPDFT
jgi:hypothetical protein